MSPATIANHQAALQALRYRIPALACAQSAGEVVISSSNGPVNLVAETSVAVLDTGLVLVYIFVKIECAPAIDNVPTASIAKFPTASATDQASATLSLRQVCSSWNYTM